MVSGRTRPRSLIAETRAMEAEGQLFFLGRMPKEKPLMGFLETAGTTTVLSMGSRSDNPKVTEDKLS